MSNHSISNGKLLHLKVDELRRQASEQLQTQRVSEVIVALGSNYQAEQHLASIHKSLHSLGSVSLSTAFENADFTATIEQPKPDYVNQCIHLCLNTNTSLGQLHTIFKALEKRCGRQRAIENQSIIKQVAMDIDILLVKLQGSDEWVAMANRYPFKDHESVGLMELSMAIM